MFEQREPWIWSFYVFSLYHGWSSIFGVENERGSLDGPSLALDILFVVPS